jgi:DNA-binding transcriptional ArsR family regulator
MQAQTVRSRWRRAQHAYEVLDGLLDERHLPERALDALYSGLLGYRLRRPTYVERTGIDARTASRDFRALTDAGLLRAVGETKGRYYVAGPALDDVRRETGRGERLRDPYPWMGAELAKAAANVGQARTVAD